MNQERYLKKTNARKQSFIAIFLNLKLKTRNCTLQEVSNLIIKSENVKWTKRLGVQIYHTSQDLH